MYVLICVLIITHPDLCIDNYSTKEQCEGLRLLPLTLSSPLFYPILEPQVSQTCGVGETDPILPALGLKLNWFRLISTSLVSPPHHIDWLAGEEVGHFQQDATPSGPPKLPPATGWRTFLRMVPTLRMQSQKWRGETQILSEPVCLDQALPGGRSRWIPELHESIKFPLCFSQFCCCSISHV